MERDSFIFYRSFYEGIKELPRDIQGEVLTAVMEYGLNGVTTENLKPIAKGMLALIKPQLDANNKRFENGKKGAEHGKKGGRPKKETPKKPQENPNETPNVNVNDNVNVNNTSFLEKKKQKIHICDFSKNSENDFSKNENPNPELKAENKKRQTEGGGGENSKHGGCTENSHRNGEILNEHAEVEQMYVESKKEPKKARFCKPTISEVQEYCYARQNLVDAERFYNYYESNGWKVGKNPMKDWKACVRTWERNGYDTKTNVNQYGTNTDANNEPKFGRMPASEVAKSISGWGD